MSEIPYGGGQVVKYIQTLNKYTLYRQDGKFPITNFLFLCRLAVALNSCNISTRKQLAPPVGALAKCNPTSQQAQRLAIIKQRP